MKNLRWWAVIGAAAAGVGLTSCGSSDSGSGQVSLRVVNSTLSHPSIDLLINATVVSTAVTSDTVSTYVTPSSGSNTLQVNDTGSTTSLFASAPTLIGSDHYTLVAYESAGTVKTVVVGEDTVLPAAGTTLRIVDVASEAGKIDVYILPDSTTVTGLASPCRTLSGGPTVTFGVSTSQQVAALPEGAGTYRVCVTGGGNATDLRLDMPNVVLGTAQVADLILTPASGGLLVNGGLLIQQSTYSAVRNTGTRVRLAAAATGGATVGVVATSGTDSYTIAAPTASPQLGNYVLVPANSSLNITSNSSSVGAPATPLVAGADMTLLVYGDAASPTPKLFTDDNRPPTDSTAVKLRLINGVTGNAGVLSLSANSTPAANSIAPSFASTYSSISVNTNNPITLTLLSTLSPGNYLTVTQSLNANTSYTVMAAGDAAAPQLLIR